MAAQTKHGLRAQELFTLGYNCSQAVLGAFCEELGLDMDTAMKLSSSFGGGIGRMREVCGAFSGLCMAAGLLCSGGTPEREDKTKQYELVQSLAKEFRDENGSIVCRELLGLSSGPSSPTPDERTAQYYKKRPCSELVGFAADMLERQMNGKAD